MTKSLKMFVFFILEIFTESYHIADRVFSDISYLQYGTFIERHKKIFTGESAETKPSLTFSTIFDCCDDIIWFRYLPKPYVWDFESMKDLGYLPKNIWTKTILCDIEDKHILEIEFCKTQPELWNIYCKTKDYVDYFKHSSLLDKCKNAVVFSSSRNCKAINNSVRYGYFINNIKAKTFIVKSMLRAELLHGVIHEENVLLNGIESHKQFKELYLDNLFDAYISLLKVESSWNFPTPKCIRKRSFRDVNIKNTFDNILKAFKNILANDIDGFSKLSIVFSGKSQAMSNGIDQIVKYVESSENPTSDIMLDVQAYYQTIKRKTQKSIDIQEIEKVVNRLEEFLQKAVTLFEKLIAVVRCDLKTFLHDKNQRSLIKLNWLSSAIDIFAYKDFYVDLATDVGANFDELQDFIFARDILDKIIDTIDSCLAQQKQKFEALKLSDKYLIDKEKTIQLIDELSHEKSDLSNFSSYLKYLYEKNDLLDKSKLGYSIQNESKARLDNDFTPLSINSTTHRTDQEASGLNAQLPATKGVSVNTNPRNGQKEKANYNEAHNNSKPPSANNKTAENSKISNSVWGYIFITIFLGLMIACFVLAVSRRN